jgi:hypothetical protein
MMTIAIAIIAVIASAGFLIAMSPGANTADDRPFLMSFFAAILLVISLFAFGWSVIEIMVTV